MNYEWRSAAGVRGDVLPRFIEEQESEGWEIFHLATYANIQMGKVQVKGMPHNLIPLYAVVLRRPKVRVEA